MSTLLTRLTGFLLVAALLAAGVWYLTQNPQVGRSFAGVVAGGLVLSIWAGRRRSRVARMRIRTLGDLLSLTPSGFEEAVAGVLARTSYRKVRVVGKAADLGVDIACFDHRGRPVVVQCKRHAPGIAVGSGEVQRFLGSITHAGADRGILVTTSRFSAPAIDLAEQHEIELIDGEELVEMVRRAGCRKVQTRT
ncbi:MAG: restriction endonuclease [Actinomycetota bacterium]